MIPLSAPDCDKKIVRSASAIYVYEVSVIFNASSSVPLLALATQMRKVSFMDVSPILQLFLKKSFLEKFSEIVFFKV